jgi:toxin ParE1/3/4
MIALQWSDDAEADVDNITSYIAKNNIIAAIDMRDAIELRVKNLKTFPKGWRTGRIAGTREMVLTGTPYIAVYEVADDDITILRILHASQKWPPE